MTPKPLLLRHARLATFADAAGWGLIDDGALLVADGRIAWLGADARLPPGTEAEELDLGGALLTPGLIDAHTHLVYGGDRAAEFEQRLEGASYEQIAKAGGGIRSTVRATREASAQALFDATAARARALMRGGVTTVEIKSGYGLDAASEARCLGVARRIGAELPLNVCTTSLALHALPDEFAGRADDYVSAAIGWLEAQQAAGLVDAVDAFCETIGFTPAQTERLFAAARRLGLPVKLHAEQLSNQHGTALAARYGALSADHLEHLDAAGVAAMHAAGTVAMLLPGAYYFLRDTTLPPVAELRRQGVPMAIATDHNPGTSPCLSLPLMLNMACTLFRLTPEEAWRGVTVHAARALGLADRGRLAVGQRADLALWDTEHPRDLAYRFGTDACRRAWCGGRDTTSTTGTAAP